MGPALLQQPQLGVLAQPQGALSDPNLVSAAQAGYPIPTTPLEHIRNFLGFGFDHIYAPLMDSMTRGLLTPQQVQEGIATDPAFAKANQDWQNYMNYYRNIVSPE